MLSQEKKEQSQFVFVLSIKKDKVDLRVIQSAPPTENKNYDICDINFDIKSTGTSLLKQLLMLYIKYYFFDMITILFRLENIPNSDHDSLGSR